MNKIKVNVVYDEWYPVIVPAETKYYTAKIKVSADLWKRYNAALRKFSKLLEEVKKEGWES